MACWHWTKANVSANCEQPLVGPLPMTNIYTVFALKKGYFRTNSMLILPIFHALEERKRILRKWFFKQILQRWTFCTCCYLEILIIVMLLWKQKAFQMFCVRFYTNPVNFCVDIFYCVFKFSHSLFTFRLHGYAVQGNCRYICRSLM